MITTNKVVSQLNLQIIKHYIKNISNIEVSHVKVSRLSQSKSYLKIISIPYFIENTNTPIIANVVKTIIKENHIFNNIVLASRLRIIKVSPKSDMSIIWINIWDVKAGTKAKDLINRCFNIGSYIATVRDTNINLGVSQCKNCWKWEHTTGMCRIQGSKYIKCYSLHKSEYHHHFLWCCKANNKTNPPRLETKQEESCPHSFKCLNCKGDH